MQPSVRFSFICSVFGAAHLDNARLFLRNYRDRIHDDGLTELILVEGLVPGCRRYAVEGAHTVLSFPVVCDFPKCFLLNRGVEAARGEFFVFHDADLVFPLGIKDDLMRISQSFKAFTNFSKVVRLTELETREVLADPQGTQYGYGLEFKGTRTHSARSVQCGGSVTVHREVFEACGGWNEAFTQWGGEDQEMGARIRHVTGKPVFHRTPQRTLLHLWHPRSKLPTPESGPLGKELLARTRQDPAAIVEELRRRRGHRASRSSAASDGCW